MSPEIRHSVAELVRAVQHLLHVVQADVYLASGLESSVRSLGTVVERGGSGSSARRALGRVDADLGLLACRVGLCREVVVALRALHAVGAALRGAHGLPSWNLDAAPTWDPVSDEAGGPLEPGAMLASEAP